MNGTPHSLTTPAISLAPATGPARPISAEQAKSAGVRWAAVAALSDPEWLPFVLPLCLPALFCLVFGEFQRASFFGGMALSLGVLKWLGWLVLTRRFALAPRFVL